jgi:hypothetical protein
MPFIDFLKKIGNKIISIFIPGDRHMSGLFEDLKKNPQKTETAKQIQDEFVKNPIRVITEVLRRVKLKDKNPESEADLFVQLRKTWHNTIKKEQVQPLQIIKPASKQEVVDLIKNAETNGLLVKAVGKGHSFSDVANATDILVDMLGLCNELPVETDTLKSNSKTYFNAQAGMLVQQANSLLDARQLALHTMAAFDQETIYGAIATSTHGTGLNVSGMSAMTRSIDLVAAGGKSYRVEPTQGITDPVLFHTKYPAGEITLIQEDEKFYSLVVGLGMMGIVYSIVIEPVPAFSLIQHLWVTDWETVLPKLKDRSFFSAIDSEWTQANQNPDGSYPPNRAQVFVNPYITKNYFTQKETHTCVVQIQLNVSAVEYAALLKEQSEEPKSKLLAFVEDLMSNGNKGVHEASIAGEDKESIISEIGIDALVELLNDFPLLTPLFLDLSMIVLLSGSGKFGKSFIVMNQGKLAIKNAGYSVEPGFSVNENNDFIKGAEEIIRVAKLSAESYAYLTSPFCMRFVKESDDYMSPEYRSDTCMIDVPMVLGTIGGDQMYDRMQVDLLALGARPHWGKINNLVNGEDLIRKMYPKYDSFLKTIAFFNPNGNFNGRFSYRTGISKIKFPEA